MCQIWYNRTTASFCSTCESLTRNLVRFLLNDSSLLNNDMVAVTVNHDSPVNWTAPRALLRRVSRYFDQELSEPSVTSLACLDIWNDAFKLFLQWSFFQKHQEYAWYAPEFDNSEKCYSLEKEPRTWPTN